MLRLGMDGGDGWGEVDPTREVTLVLDKGEVTALAATLGGIRDQLTKLTGGAAGGAAEQG